MMRIRFSTAEDRIKGNYLLATNTVVRVLRGQVFEIAEQDVRILNDNQISYEVLPIPDPTTSHEEIRNPLAVEL